MVWYNLLLLQVYKLIIILIYSAYIPLTKKKFANYIPVLLKTTAIFKFCKHQVSNMKCL